MPKIMTIAGMVIALVVLLLFGLDLALGFPFQGANLIMDIGMVVASVVLAYLSWSAFRELR